MGEVVKMAPQSAAPEFVQYELDGTILRRPGVRLRNMTNEMVGGLIEYGPGPRPNPRHDHRKPAGWIFDMNGAWIVAKRPGPGVVDNREFLPAMVMVRGPDGHMALREREPGDRPRLVVMPGEDLVVDLEGIETLIKTECTVCLGSQKLYRCEDPANHERQIVGGPLHRLARITPEGELARMAVSPMLDDAPAPVLVDDQLHQRVMERLGRGAK